jgi:hypothetical protein
MIEKFINVNFHDQIRREIHEHEVFMGFGNDDDAIAFREWWDDRGAALFQQWLCMEGKK